MTSESELLSRWHTLWELFAVATIQSAVGGLSRELQYGAGIGVELHHPHQGNTAK